METDRVDPRRQLDEFNEAVRASDAGAWQPAPLWFFPLFALAGPAIVAWTVAGGEAGAGDYSAARENLLRFGSIALGAIALGALAFGTYKEWTNAEVRPKPPIQGGRTSRWMFLATFAMTLGLLGTNPLVSDSNALLIVCASYLWLMVVPWLLYARHVKVMAQS